MDRCNICHESAPELCNDGVCRPCHKTESFEDCLADKQVNEVRKQAGLPARGLTA